jgi:hypothetical protein
LRSTIERHEHYRDPRRHPHWRISIGVGGRQADGVIYDTYLVA